MVRAHRHDRHSKAGLVPTDLALRIPVKPAFVKRLRYYDIQKHWQKIKFHLVDETLNQILVKDFNKYTWGRWRRRFLPGTYPEEFESCDWRWSRARRGPCPAFWRYVKHAACHWLVNFAARLAQLTEPSRAWRIVTSQKHSTVWDSQYTLFDLQFLALDVTVKECWELAALQSDTRFLSIGEQREVYCPSHYTRDLTMKGSKTL